MRRWGCQPRRRRANFFRREDHGALPAHHARTGDRGLPRGQRAFQPRLAGEPPYAGRARAPLLRLRASRPGVAPGKYAGLVQEVDELVARSRRWRSAYRPISRRASTTPCSCCPRSTGLASSPIPFTPMGAGCATVATTRAAAIFQLFRLFGRDGEGEAFTDVFRQAAIGLGFHPSQIVHVGDRESNDVAGPMSIGMRRPVHGHPRPGRGDV